MPRYFFDTADGRTRFHDEVGTELPDDHAARDEATQTLAGMARDYLPSPSEPQRDIMMWVRNEAGDTVLQLALTFAIHRPKRPDEP